jgi:NO-binding membrane sensor protein with MHYT domain
MTFFVVIATASEVIALWCAVNLWRTHATLIRKLVWTMILFVPILGPVFYGGMFEVPSVQSEGLRSNNEWHD